MAPRLKVFVTSDGLTDYVVAASSRAKALAAWGSHQDLFKTGLAHETDEADLIKAAQAQPEIVLRRPAGSRKTLAAIKARPKAKAKPAGPTKAQLARIAALEARLDALDRDHAKAAADLEARHAAAVAKVQTDLDKARAAAREA
jgi:hypothetical protein